jgi:hypothetical protein
MNIITDTNIKNDSNHECSEGMGGSDTAREARAVVEQANRKVDEAMQHLQASRPVYRMSEAPAPNVPSSRSMAPSSSSSSYVSSTSRPQQRFGSSGGSSSHMLAGLRNSQAAVGQVNAINPSVSTNAVALGRDVHTQIVPEVRTHSNPTSISGDISKRLGILFTNSINSDRGRDNGLNTDYILHNFRDLGDQYASMFKDTLHQMAVLKDGKWYKR